MTAHTLAEDFAHFLTVHQLSQQESFTRADVERAYAANWKPVQSLVAVVPEGHVLAPLVPTEYMVVAGFESAPWEGFSPIDEWEAYEAMSGCQQAAHRARLCYAAMLTAIPGKGETNV